MSVIDELLPLLKKLKLSGVLQTIDIRLDEARGDELGYEEFLYRLLKDETERREAKQLEQRVRRASFEHRKTLEDFDFHFNPDVPKAKVLDLATCAFVERKQNVLLLGKTGVGKSHIAQAIGHRACRAGNAVLYVSAQDLLKQLRASRADNSHDKKLARLAEVDLLIIDDLGLRSLTDAEPLDLYEIIRLRYERGSATRSLPVLPWTGSSTERTSCGSPATPTEIHPNTAGATGTTTHHRRPHEQYDQGDRRSPWPIRRVLPTLRPRALRGHRDPRISLADLRAVH
jgi:DNA replication protein DnaC